MATNYSALLSKLSDLWDNTEDPKLRDDLGKQRKKLQEKLQIVMRAKVKENDKKYKELMEKIDKTNNSIITAIEDTEDVAEVVKGVAKLVDLLAKLA